MQETSFRLSELGRFLENSGILSNLQFDKDPVIVGFSPIGESSPGTLSWTKNTGINWDEVESAAVICPSVKEIPQDVKPILIFVENPRLAFIKIVQRFGAIKPRNGIEPTAVLGEGCELGKNIYIGHYTVIGDNVCIGDETVIDANVTVHDNVRIGSGCLINSGVVIGGDGFGFEKAGNEIVKFPHIGGVLIEDGVEIGGNTCIDRGTLGNTVIKKNAKIDNLCHIAHNITIGEGAFVIACSMLGGSSKIGKSSWIAPGAIIREGVIVGNSTTIGLGAVVLNDVADGDTVIGVPAKPMNTNRQTLIT